MMTTEEMIKYDQIVELEIATPEEISLVRAVATGTWNEILDGIVYARTGYRTLEQMLAEDDDEQTNPIHPLLAPFGAPFLFDGAPAICAGANF